MANMKHLIALTTLFLTVPVQGQQITGMDGRKYKGSLCNATLMGSHTLPKTIRLDPRSGLLGNG